MLIASIITGACAAPPEEHRLSVHTSAASFFHEVQVASALMAQCSNLCDTSQPVAEHPENAYQQLPRQLKAIYHFFSWQHPDQRTLLIEMLHGQMMVKSCKNVPQMKAITNGLEQMHEQLLRRDDAYNRSLR